MKKLLERMLALFLSEEFPNHQSEIIEKDLRGARKFQKRAHEWIDYMYFGGRGRGNKNRNIND